MQLSIHLYYRHGFFHTVMKSAILISHQQCFLSKQPNIMLPILLLIWYEFFISWLIHTSSISHNNNYGSSFCKNILFVKIIDIWYLQIINTQKLLISFNLEVVIIFASWSSTGLLSLLCWWLAFIIHWCSCCLLCHIIVTGLWLLTMCAVFTLYFRWHPIL